MKSDTYCFICGWPFQYKARYEHTADVDLFGGPICHTCKSRGFNHFLSHKKEMLRHQMEEEIKSYAKKIEANKSLLGDWWQKNSALFKFLMEGE